VKVLRHFFESMHLKDFKALLTSRRAIGVWLVAVVSVLAALAAASLFDALQLRFWGQPASFLMLVSSSAVAAFFGGFWQAGGQSSSQCPEIEEELLHTKSHLHSVLDNSPVPVSIKDMDGKLVLANHSMLEALDLTIDGALGRNIYDQLPRAMGDRFWHSDQRALQAGGTLHQVEELLHKDGQNHTYMTARFPITCLDTEQPLGMCSMWVDITAQKKAEEKLVHVAQHDALTGLPNRALVYEFGELLLGAARRSDGKLAVLFFDLERFKTLNDAYGREAGDGMLQEIARRLRRNVRGSDLVGRMGSDEFVVILSDIQSEQDLANSAGHLREVLRQPYQADEFVLQASPSIGISMYPNDGGDIDTLIRHADAAMRHARDSGQAGYQFFTPAIQSNIQRTISIEQKFRQGIEQGEFELYYQPVVETRTRRIVGAEALIRWPQADGEIMQPHEFIQVAEANGFINQLGTWVIQEACRQLQQWHAQGLPRIRIAVNVSPVQFRARNFYQRVADVVACSGIDPSLLELEVTESAVMKQVNEASQTLASLKELGLQIALDDFGTGYSSLSRLAGLPFDKLKVDQSFIRNIDTDSRSLAVAETVIALGKRLGIKVVAEGIETEAAFSLLRECKCDLGQGYLLSRPMPAEQFRLWHRQHNLALA